jgi:BlaI family transcriptional regulator, penicillinase repressor
MVQPLPTDGELEILQVLWDRGPSTVREVHDALGDVRGVGYTTVLKLLQIMLEKGLVTRRDATRSHIYRAAVGRERVQKRLLADLLDRAFEGATGPLVMQALSSRRAAPDELEQIRALLDRLEAEQ